MKRIIMGDYAAGDGVFGIKCSLAGYDVSVRADDQDVTKRSFNSEWTSLCKIKVIGVAQSEWTQYQTQGGILQPPNGTRVFSISGWQQVTPVIIPHGFSYIPIWEERLYDPTTKTIWDDYLYPFAQSTNEASFSGARSYHSGPSTSPQDAIFMTPWTGRPGFDSVHNENYFFWNPVTTFPGYPAYPAYPTKPTIKPAQIYVIYNNQLGTMV